MKPPANKARWLAIPAVLLVGGSMLYGCLVGFDRPAQAGDRELVMTIEDLTTGMDFTKDPTKESLKRTWYIDGSVDVLYEYSGAEGKLPVYLSSQVSRASSRSDADGQYIGMKLGASATTKMIGEGVSEVTRDDLLKWGDSSTSVLLTAPHGPVGNYFVAQKGDRVFMVTFTGIFFDTKEAYEKLLLPKLTRATAAKL